METPRQAAESTYVGLPSSVEDGGKLYRSPSLAASAARVALGYAGMGKAATNGWTWWSYTDAEGATRRLDHLRNASSTQ